jgi:GT2 family glycosyltransferase/glycosyltransferase involved in cell wall biosynthesis
MPQDKEPRHDVDVVIPVYRDLDLTRACLTSVLKTGSAREVVVVDDATPEPELSSFLDRLAAQGQITLLRHAVNRGFVHSVNRAMALHPTRDAIVLNADTQVHGDWIARLRRAAYSREQVATVTPFGNNAEIASHPLPGVVNDMDPARLACVDRAFAAANAGATIAMPTAIGFCMYIRRTAWQQVGSFDEVAFGRGYGEENDFCLRATALGWHHLLACDVFVYHRGGASFGQQAKARRLAAMAILRQRYPNYEPGLHAFLAADPPARFRLQADLWRLSHSPRPRVLFLAHNRGGGTWRHMEDLAALLGDRLEVLVLSPAPGRQVRLVWLCNREHLGFLFRIPEERHALGIMLRQLGVMRVHIHHLVDLPPVLAQLPQWLGVAYDVTIHDYFAICPRITLTGINERYCGEPDEAGCNRCIKRWPRPTRLSIDAWRSEQHDILAGAQRLFVPSRDAMQRLQRHFPDLALVHAPHPESMEPSSPTPSLVKYHPGEGELRVVVVGVLSRLKGALLVNQVAELAARRKLPMTIHVLGPIRQGFSRLARQVIVQHGAYEDQNLSMLLQEVSAHVAWFPTRWPETWSYTLSACLRAGLPVVAPGFGAFAERLAGRTGQLVPPEAPALQWLLALSAWRTAQPGSRPQVGSCHVESGPGFNYARDYVDPLMGVKAPPTDWSQLQTLIFILLQGTRRGGYGAKLVMILAWLRSRPQLGFLASRIPGSWQTLVKRFLLGQGNNV